MKVVTSPVLSDQNVVEDDEPSEVSWFKLVLNWQYSFYNYLHTYISTYVFSCQIIFRLSTKVEVCAYEHNYTELPDKQADQNKRVRSEDSLIYYMKNGGKFSHLFHGKVRTFWEEHKIWKKSSSWFGHLLSKCPNHEEDFFKLFLFLRKSEL